MSSLLKLIQASTALLCILCLTGCEHKTQAITIGIIEPLEHKAMAEIVSGFSETLRKEYKNPVIIDVENAQNDPNLEHAIIQKMINQRTTIIAPIGVDATEMTLSMTKNTNIPVVSLASDMTEQDRKNLHSCHVAIVHDEIKPNILIHFIHTAYPTLTRLTLIHSAANKVFPEVKDAVIAAKSEGITLQPVMVSSLPELNTAAQVLPVQTQGIFVLKDSLIVSGIATLAHAAAKHHIPLITSDQGSVEDGAGFALGVHEREIGVEGAKLTAAILQGKSACNLPISEMQNLTVFINQEAMSSFDQDVEKIISTARSSNYATELTGNKRG